MSLTSENMGPADIKAMTSNDGMWGGGGAIFYLFILFFFFMFFCNGGMFGNGGNAGAAIPFMMGTTTQNDVQSGFDHAAVVGGINDLGQTINRGFADAEVSRCNQQANITQQISQNYSAFMQQMGNNHSDVMQGFANMAYAQQGNANETQRGIADLKYTVAQENCSDRNAMNLGFQRMEASLDQKVQAVLDKMCQQEIEQKNDTIQQLRQQLYMASLTASQGQQTGIINGNTDAQVQSAINQLKQPAPVPAYIVGNPNGCNCGYNFGGCCGANA